VEASRGAEGGYRLGAGAAMPPLLLDDEEAVAIAVGLRTAAAHAVEGLDEASVRALAKLEQVLPSRLRYRVTTLGTATTALPGSGPSVDPGLLTLFAAAAANRERARFRYRTHDGEESRRHVEPHRLVTAGRRWYLVGFDLDRGAWRSFRIDRIEDPVATGARSAQRDLPDAAEFLTSSMYAMAPTYRADVTVHAPAADVVGRLGDTPGDVVPVDERMCRVRSHSDTLEWIAFRLVQLGCAFEVHSPPELRDYLRALGDRVSRAAR
jgi:predicted DNA-binding transcriptional regulator YafY